MMLNYLNDQVSDSGLGCEKSDEGVHCENMSQPLWTKGICQAKAIGVLSLGIIASNVNVMLTNNTRPVHFKLVLSLSCQLYILASSFL